MKISKSFIKYSIGGIIKTIINLMLLWLFIDTIVLPFSNTIVRLVVFGITFVVTYFIYDWVGYSKKDE